MSIDRYFNELRDCLRKLSDEERNEIIDFYREYAEDSAISEYDQMAEHFGTPRELSSRIYAESAEKYAKTAYEQNAFNKSCSDNSKTSRGSNIWKGLAIALAGLFALPFSFPVLIICAAVSFSLLVSVISIIFAIIGTILTLGVTGFYLFFKSFTFLSPFMPVIWIKSLVGGLALIVFAAGVIILLFFLLRFVAKLITLFLSKLVIKKNNNMNKGHDYL